MQTGHLTSSGGGVSTKTIEKLEDKERVNVGFSPSINPAGYGFDTRVIHAGQPPDPTTGAVVFPISLATTFQQASPGVHKGFEYSRTGNPTRQAFEANVAAAESAKFGVAFASGSATTMTICNMYRPGDHVIVMDDCYGGTYRYFTKVAAPTGVSVTFFDFNNQGEFEKQFTSHTRLVWMETPTNPLLKIVDIAHVAGIVKKRNAQITDESQKILLVVDNTFLSPYFQNPLNLGADIVVHSVTKYINGHSDVVMGIALTNNQAIFDKLKFLQNAIGAVPSPFDCFLAMRGMKTLSVRMRQHEKNAMTVAKYLSTHDRVEKVVYPGLETHPQHELCKVQMKGFGGMVTFFLKGGMAESRAFLENLKVWKLAESLGAVESLVDHPAIMTHAAIPQAEREKLGISDTLVRLSVGIEDVNDLVLDLGRALAATEKAK